MLTKTVASTVYTIQQPKRSAITVSREILEPEYNGPLLKICTVSSNARVWVTLEEAKELVDALTQAVADLT